MKDIWKTKRNIWGNQQINKFNLKGQNPNLFLMQNLKKKHKKDLTYSESRLLFNLTPFGDADKDKTKNIFDCHPFDRSRQGVMDKAKEWISDKFAGPVEESMLEKRKKKKSFEGPIEQPIKQQKKQSILDSFSKPKSKKAPSIPPPEPSVQQSDIDRLKKMDQQIKSSKPEQPPLEEYYTPAQNWEQKVVEPTKKAKKWIEEIPESIEKRIPGPIAKVGKGVAKVTKEGVKTYKTMFPGAGVLGKREKEIEKVMEKYDTEGSQGVYTQEEVEKILGGLKQKEEKEKKLQEIGLSIRRQEEKFAEGPTTTPTGQPISRTKESPKVLYQPQAYQIMAAQQPIVPRQEDDYSIYPWQSQTTASIMTPGSSRQVAALKYRGLAKPLKGQTVFQTIRQEDQLRREMGIEKPLPPAGGRNMQTGEPFRVPKYVPVNLRQSFVINSFIKKPDVESPEFGEHRQMGKFPRSFTGEKSVFGSSRPIGVIPSQRLEPRPDEYGTPSPQTSINRYTIEQVEGGIRPRGVAAQARFPGQSVGGYQFKFLRNII